MNIEELIHDLRARINPQYFDQIGTESYERNQCVMALEYLREENERQRFDILAMNQSLDLLREENERLKADAGLIEWQPIETAPKDKRILLYRPTASEWWRVMGGHYDSDEYLKTPKPYWGSDNFGIAKAAQRQNPPTHWMPLPESPK